MTCPHRKNGQCEATPPDGGVQCDTDCQYIEELLHGYVAGDALNTLFYAMHPDDAKRWAGYCKDDLVYRAANELHALRARAEKAEAEARAFFDEHANVVTRAERAEAELVAANKLVRLAVYAAEHTCDACSGNGGHDGWPRGYGLCDDCPTAEFRAAVEKAEAEEEK